MAWVTLTLRKAELKRVHAALQLEDLKISREKRQMQRKYALEKMYINDEVQEQIRTLRNTYKTTKSELMADRDGSSDLELQNSLTEAKETYEEQSNLLQSQAEDEAAMIEEEASMIESQLDEQQVTIEAQMEAVSKEIEAVNSQISTDIGNSAIKLS